MDQRSQFEMTHKKKHRKVTEIAEPLLKLTSMLVTLDITDFVAQPNK